MLRAKGAIIELALPETETAERLYEGPKMIEKQDGRHPNASRGTDVVGKPIPRI